MLFQILFGIYTVDVGIPIKLVRLETGQLYFIADLTFHPGNNFTARSQAKSKSTSRNHSDVYIRYNLRRLSHFLFPARRNDDQTLIVLLLRKENH